MKRLILLMLALLLLTACSGQNEPGGSTAATTVPAPSGLYLPNSSTEQQTGGAVRVYEITGNRVLTLDMGVAVLDEQGKLTLIDREEGMLQSTCSGMGDLRAVSGNSVFYYDTDLHAYNLKTAEKHTWQLPDEIVGDFAVGTQTREIYYCTEGSIYALHMDTGLPRLLKQHSYTQQSIFGAYFGGQVIGWETEEGISYLSAENGLTLQKENNIHTLHSSLDMYLALRTDGIVEQTLFGMLDGQSQQLNVDAMSVSPAFAQQGAVTVDVDQGLQLSFYDLNTGKKNASTVIAQEDNCLDLTADDRYVWILTETALYRWDVTKSAIQDETVYTSAVWTAEAPDVVGMAQNMHRIDQLQKTYGVKIHVGTDAVKNSEEYAMLPEYQVKAISTMLDALEPCLAEMPENFLKTTVKNGWVRICLVRQLQSETGYVRYWHDGDCYIAISLAADMREAFLSGLGGAIDSNILGNSRDLEYWNDLNPKGFGYTYAEPVSEEYKEYVPAFFADTISMTYPTEDRARVFYHAMLQDNQELFAQEVMQKKLKLLCEGIREAYNLNKYTEVLPWEQYLAESLAYVEE